MGATVARRELRGNGGLDTADVTAVLSDPVSACASAIPPDPTASAGPIPLAPPREEAVTPGAVEREWRDAARWMAQSALELGVPLGAITQSVFAQLARRKPTERSIIGPLADARAAGGTHLAEQVAAALCASRMATFSECLDHIVVASGAYGWRIDLGEIVRLWRGTGIVTDAMLERIAAEYRHDPRPTSYVMPTLATELRTLEGAWRQGLSWAMSASVPVPGLTAALSHYDLVNSAPAR